MAKHYSRTREGHWRRSIAINMTSGIVCTIVVAIFAIVKFTEGAWVVVIVFPTLVYMLIRLNREYREEEQVLARSGRRCVLPGTSPATSSAVRQRSTWRSSVRCATGRR